MTHLHKRCKVSSLTKAVDQRCRREKNVPSMSYVHVYQKNKTSANLLHSIERHIEDGSRMLSEDELVIAACIINLLM